MPCIKCSAEFTLLNWKLKCVECEENHCSRCLRKNENYAICGVCCVLIKRPPVREELMDLKVKDLQTYLTKHKISTHGLVEKGELVELFFRHTIPVRYKKTNKRFPTTLGGSVPNLTARSLACIQTIKNNAETAINNVTRSVPRSDSTLFCNNGGTPTRRAGQASNSSAQANPERSNTPPPRPPPSYFQTTDPTTSSTTTNTNNEEPKQEATPEVPEVIRNLPKLSDISSNEELQSLSVKQIKQILTLNRVDYKGCVEKSELIDRLQRLWQDSSQKTTNSDDFENVCKICMDAQLDCVLLECGHIATCINCGKRLNECPICRQYVVRVVRTFKA